MSSSVSTHSQRQSCPISKYEQCRQRKGGKEEMKKGRNKGRHKKQRKGTECALWKSHLPYNKRKKHLEELTKQKTRKQWLQKSP